MVQLDGRAFAVTYPLGEGSFGVVWGAESDDGREVAIKEILCQSQAELSRATFEGCLLRALGEEASSIGGEALRQVPSLVASDTEALGTDVWRVRLAMTRIPGEPLEKFLEQWRPADLRSPRSLARGLSEACRYTWELVAQLAQTFERVSCRAYHRDVNPRNILIDDKSGQRPSFGLIDFGLAVDSLQWQLDAVKQDNLSGDCRYWPVSAWLAFERGLPELSKHAALGREYKSELDFHALGVTAVQCLIGLSPRLEEISNLPDEDLLLGLRALRVAWEKYWADASGFWRRIVDAFRNGGDIGALAEAHREAGVHDVMAANIGALRAAVGGLREACERAPPEANLAGVPALLDVLLVLLRRGKGSHDKPSWRRVISMLRKAPQMETVADASQERVRQVEVPVEVLEAARQIEVKVEVLEPSRHVCTVEGQVV